MAYMMPVVLLTWMLVIFALFYYHDKTIILGAAYESAIVGSERDAKGDVQESEVIVQYFQKRIKGKLLFFSDISAVAQMEEERIVVTAEARKRGMHLAVSQSAAVLYPEQEIRKGRRIKEALEERKE